MSLYKKDNPEWLKVSIDSMLAQTKKAHEFVIIKDGPLTEQLNELLQEYQKLYPGLFKIHSFETNQGLGRALAYGVTLCESNLIARMDADDYSIPTRCEQQINKFNDDPSLDVIGSNVKEFINSMDNVVSYVNLPELNNNIVKFAKRRCPVRHPSLMYKKDKVLLSGNYRDFRHAQDYNLIVHMILKGCKFYNFQDYFVYMRVNEDFYKRRGGLKQFNIVLKLKREFLKLGFYSYTDFLVSGVGNALICLMPNNIRGLIYKKILRR